MLTPTNPFSDGFDDDEDPLVKGVQISSDGPNASSVIGSKASIESRIATSDEGISSSTDSIGGTPKKCPPSKPPRILLRADTEMREDDAISDTHSPKRILSVDKSLLADLKVLGCSVVVHCLYKIVIAQLYTYAMVEPIRLLILGAFAR